MIVNTRLFNSPGCYFACSLLSLLIIPSFSFAAGPNTTLILANIGTIANIVQSVAVVMGVGLIFSGVMKLKHYGEMRTMMNSQGSLANALFILLGGVILLTLPTMLNSFLLAFWGTTSPLPYPTNNDPGVNAMLPPIVMFVRLVGVISFIRGVILLTRLGKEGGYQQGGLGKALMFIIGGILCVHIVGTAQLLESILGFTGA